MTHNPYAPPEPKLADTARLAARAASIVATRFAAAAAIVATAGILLEHFVVDHSKEPFPFPLRTTLAVAIAFGLGSFIWCWVTSNLTAKIARGVAPETSKVSIIFGVLFSVLSYALAYLLRRVEASSVAGLSILFVWSLAYPIVATLIVVRRAAPPNTSLEQTRDR